jgi:acetyltransferase-like isoleucine patch superfamily enzyme
MKDPSNLYENKYNEPEFHPIHPDIEWGEDCTVRHFVVIEEDCKFGDKCFIGNNTTIRSGNKFGDRCVVGHNVCIEANGQFGNHVTINANCHMTQGIRIRDEVFIGPGVITMNTKHISYGRKSISRVYQPPIIERAARIGGGVLILPGVTIGENSVIGAGSVVTKSIPARVIAWGSPAEVIARIRDEDCL